MSQQERTRAQIEASDCHLRSRCVSRSATRWRHFPFQSSNNVRVWVRILAAGDARGLRHFSPSQQVEGAGKAGCALHPRSRVQMHIAKRTRAYRFSGGNPAFPAQWFYGLLRALPGDRALLPPSPRGYPAHTNPVGRLHLPQNLTPASGCQDHTTSPSATCIVRLRAGLPLTGNPPCDRLCTPTLPRPPHPAPRP